MIRTRTPSCILASISLALGAALLLLGIAPGEAPARGCSGAGQPIAKLSREKERRTIACLVNKERKGMGDLRSNRKLDRAARRHTYYMGRQNCFSHQCPGEPSVYDRIRNSGYFSGASSYSYGEVIALSRGRTTARDVVRRFMRSPGHRAQLLSRGYEHLGVALDGGGGKVFCTIDLGRRSG